MKLGLYGSVALQREHCSECRGTAFVIDERMACCGARVSRLKASGVRRMSQSTGKRRLPGQKEREAILAKQDNRCFYCWSVFGDVAGRGMIVRTLAPCWDHVEPFAWQSNNQIINFVAACGICNGIKSNRCFVNAKDAINAVWVRRKKRGWSTATEIAPEYRSLS